MAYPTISINNSTGSNTAASGAGPSTAKTGTAASYVTTVVTLDGTPDLSGVDATGLHVIYIQTTSGRRFFKITAVDNSLKTVTVHVAPTGTATGLTWAIGGKRKDFETTNADTKLLWGAGSAIVGMTVDIEETGSNYVNTSATTVSCIGDTTDGRITFTSSSATRPIITTATNSVNLFSASGSPALVTFRNLSFSNTAGTRGIGYNGASTTSSKFVFDGCVFDGFTTCIADGFGMPDLLLAGNELKNFTTTAGFSCANGGNITVRSNNFHDGTGSGFLQSFATTTDIVTIENNQFYNLTVRGYTNSGSASPKYIVSGNKTRACGNDGFALTNAAAVPLTFTHFNNYYHLNGGYGISFACGAIPLAAAVQFNDYNFYGSGGQANTSGTVNVLAAGVHDGTFSSDPNASAGSPVLTSATLKAAGYPQTFPGGYTGYKDPGPLQHQDSGGGSSGMLFVPNMEGT